VSHQADSRSTASEWRGTALAVLVVAFAFNVLGRGAGETYAVFLLPLEHEFGWSRSQLTSVYSVYLLVGGLIAPLVGTLFDRVGPRAVYTAGLAVLAAAYLLAGTLSSLWQFYVYVGFLIGLGVALVGMVPASGLLARWYHARLSAALGIAYAAVGCGTLLFVPVAQVLLTHLDWRGTYRAVGLALLVCLPFAAFGVPWRKFAAGHAEQQRRHLHDPARAAGWTLRAAMRTPTYWGLVSIFVFTAMGIFCVLPQAVVFLIDAGIAPVVAATAYGVAGMLSVAGVAGVGFVAGRFGYRQTVTATFLGSGLGIALLIAISFHASGWLLAGYVLVFGLCQGVRGPIISAVCTRKFAGGSVGTIYGTIYGANAVGAAFGSLMGGVLHDATGGYRAVFVFALAALVAAAMPMWVVRELREFR
jgi:MFS family permease